jgi:hypothetical protein
MSIPLVLGLTCLVVRSQIPQSQSTEQDDIEVSKRSCCMVQMTLAARERHRAKGDVSESDDFTAAAKVGNSLEKALAEGDSVEVQKATQSLRSIFALLGVSLRRHGNNLLLSKRRPQA